MEEEVVSPQEEQEVVEQVVEGMQEVSEQHEQESREVEEKQVPLSALQKMRKRAQEAEMRAEILEKYQRQQPKQQEPEEDLRRYESATIADLERVQEQSVRIAEERFWIRQNQERYEYVNENLDKFLKQRPNLAHAINSASNRYEEAWTLMEALSPKQRKQMVAPSPVKKEAPNSPSGVPKAAAMNQAVDLMSMSDKEFAEWRASQKRR